MTLAGPYAAEGQRLERQAQQTAAADGTALFRFPDVPEGMMWTGTVQIPTAPAFANFAASVAITPWGAWSGGLPFGPIQVDGRLHLEVAAQGLNPGVAYTAVLVGIAQDEYPNTIIMPAALATPPALTRIIQPPTTTTAVTFTSAPIACSNFPGARFSFVNQPLFSAVTITLGYFDTLAAAQLNAAPGAGYRQVVVNTADSATFEMLHLGDWLVIGFQSLDLGTFSLVWDAVHRPVAGQMWMPGESGGVGLSALLGPTTQSIANAATGTITSPSSGRYAGPALLDIGAALLGGPAGGGVGTNYGVQYLGPDNAWHRIIGGGWIAVPNPNTVFPVAFLCPAAPLRVQIGNGTGSTNTYAVAIYADDWRAGG